MAPFFSKHTSQRHPMVWVSNPRQAGKTTTRRALSDHYYWDNLDDRKLFLAGPVAIAPKDSIPYLTSNPSVFVFDELHQFRPWKVFLKGFFDTYSKRTRILVTGSSRLEIFKRGGEAPWADTFFTECILWVWVNY